jgi:beta-lactamase class A
MNLRIRALFAALLLVSVTSMQTGYSQTNVAFPPSGKLQAVVDNAVKATLDKFSAKNLGSNQIAVTLVDLRDPRKPEQGSYRGDVQIYPASVIKLFYLVAAHQWMEEGKLKDTPELRRAMRDMVVDSLNEATGLVVDSLTGTTSGPELSPAEMEEWYAKRNAVNRYYASLGYTNINVNRKPWCEGPYGREMQSVQLHKPNHRNWLTTDATAHLLTAVVTDQAISPERCAQMKELLHRDMSPASGSKDDQAHAFSALGLPAGTKIWSKAGWTTETRHDAAYVELPTGEKFVLVTFTVDHANERDIIATVAREVVAGMSAAK